MNVPNTLTCGRILAVPIYIVSLIFGKNFAALSIYILSSLTDYFDGLLARYLNQTTEFGAFLDPVADKLMVLTALVCLVKEHPEWWFLTPVTIMLCRELCVSALREWMAEKKLRHEVKVGFTGKLKTAVQMISTSLLLGSMPGVFQLSGLRDSFLFPTGVVLLYVSTALSVFSGWEYFRAAWVHLGKDI